MSTRRQAWLATDRPWYALGAFALLVLLWTCRRALAGVPAADDYDYLYALRFQPFDFFGSMGSNFYWRPLGRQVYYAALRPFFWTAPWVVVLVHGLFLFATFVVLFRVARRLFPAPVAACAAAFPLLAEPMRTLLVWPTGGEYLMAMLAASLAVHETLARRWWTAGLAALAALLSHEASALVLLAMLVIAWQRGAWRAGLVTCFAVAALWLAGRLLAQTHGAGWIDRGARGGSLPWQWLEATFRVVMSQLNLEELGGNQHVMIVIGYGLVVLVTIALFVGDRPPQAKRAAPAIAGAVLWLALGALPLALLAQWDSWRSPFPALWLGLVVIGLPGLARPWLAYSVLGLRTLALVLAPTASALVTLEPPPSASGMSFVRVARLQRTAETTRATLLAHDPTLPQGAVVAYWSRLAVTEIALVAPKAPRVWYGDSTITWQWLWRPGGLDQRSDVVLSFDPQTPQPAVVIEPRTMALVRAATSAADSGRARVSDSLLVAAVQAQSAHPSGQLAVWVLRNRARIAYQAGSYDFAERMNQAGFDMIGPSPEYFGMAALIAVKKGLPQVARHMALQALALEPDNPMARRAQAELDEAAP
jgi:hypothetical protein